MSLQTFDGTIKYALDTATRKMHLVQTAIDGTVTDLGSILQDSSNNGTDLTFTAVPISQGSTAGTTHIKTAVANNYARLHALVGVLSAAGTLTIQDTSSTPVIMVGAMSLGANAGCVIPFNADSRGVPVSTIGKGIDLVTSGTGAGFNGYAIVSQGTN